MIKLPTGNADAGVSTGKADFSVDVVVSKETAKNVEMSGTADMSGVAVRTNSIFRAAHSDGASAGRFRRATPPPQRRVERLRAVQRTRPDDASRRRDRSRSPLTSTPGTSPAPRSASPIRPRRVLLRRGCQLERSHARTNRSVHRRARRGRRLLRQAVPDRLSPGSEGLVAAAATAAAPAAAADCRRRRTS